MEHSLLVALRKYRPREGGNPLENFITEAFAWLLKSYDSFSKYFTEKILNLLEVEIDADTFEWSTQVNFGGVFPDMLCRIGDTALVFENKAWSHLHENQLDNYRLYANQNFNNSYLILITAAASQHSQNPDLALCWSDIYVWIQEWIGSQDDEPDFIFRDFLLLIKNEGMGPPAPISHEAILSYFPAKDFKEQVGDLIRKIEHENWEKIVNSSDYKLSIDNKRGHYYGEAWGGFGLHLLDSFRPGIFVGFLIGDKYHCTKPVLGKISPDFVVIVNFDHNLHDEYPKNVVYKQFTQNLSIQINNLSNYWNFYHHIEDQLADCINKWNPIHIRKPMIELFRGSETAEDQIQRFMDAAREVIPLIVESDEFIKLREEYREH